MRWPRGGGSTMEYYIRFDTKLDRSTIQYPEARRRKIRQGKLLLIAIAIAIAASDLWLRPSLGLVAPGRVSRSI